MAEDLAMTVPFTIETRSITTTCGIDAEASHLCAMGIDPGPGRTQTIVVGVEWDCSCGASGFTRESAADHYHRHIEDQR
jgi:hypothetical protein